MPDPVACRQGCCNTCYLCRRGCAFDGYAVNVCPTCSRNLFPACMICHACDSSFVPARMCQSCMRETYGHQICPLCKGHSDFGGAARIIIRDPTADIPPDLDQFLSKHPDIKTSEQLSIVYGPDSFRLGERKVICDLLKMNAIPAKRLVFTRLDETTPELSIFGDCPNAHRYSEMIAEVLKTNTTLTSLIVVGGDSDKRGNSMILEALKTNTTLSELGFAHTFAREEDVEALAELLKENHTLKTLNFWQSPMKQRVRETFFGILMDKAITELSFLDQKGIRNGLDDRGAAAVCELLKRNTTLTFLDLTHNDIGVDGTMLIFEGLKTNHSLKALIITKDDKGFCYGSARPDASRVQLVREIMTTNKTLTQLDLSESSFGQAAGPFIAESLKTNNTLVSLKLKNCGLDSNFGIAIGEALKVNTTLKSLDLSNNPLKREGSKPIALGFEKNHTLKALFISGVSFHKEAMLILSEALKVNTSLTVLDVSYNEFGKKRTKMVSDALKENKSLKILILSGNHISDKEAVVLSEALKINKTLTCIDVSINYCTRAGTDILQSVTQSNRALTTLVTEHQCKQPDPCSIM